MIPSYCIFYCKVVRLNACIKGTPAKYTVSMELFS